MKQIQLKINVHLHKVKLDVRFPCSLSAVLRIENEEIAWKKEPTLRIKEAVIQQSVSHKINIFYNTEKKIFSDKHISIALFLKSSNGKITAGSSHIDLNQLKNGNNNQLHLPVDKCPDKNAYIELSISYQNMSQMDILQTQTNIHIPDLVENGQSLELFTHRNKNDNKQGQYSGRQINKQKKQMYESAHGLPHFNKFQNHILKSSQKLSSFSKQKQHSLFDQVKILRAELSNQESKPNTLYHSNQPISPRNNYDSYSLKSRISQLQRQIKNSQKKADQILLQNRAMTNQKDMLQKRNKQLQFQFKTFKEKYEDMHESHDNILKKNEFRQNHYKEQIKTLTDKLSLSQNEKQRMIFEKNDSVNNFQERQKLLRLNIKQKEKGLIDDKGKLIKKIQQLTAQIEQYQLIKHESQSKVESMSTLLSSQIKNQKEMTQNNEQLIKQIDRLKVTINDYKFKIKQLEQLNSNKLDMEDQKKKIKKKLNEAEQENINICKNAVILQTNIQRLTKRIEELQLLLKDKNSQNKAALKEQQNKEKQIQNHKKIIEQKQKKIEQILQKKHKQIQKLDQSIEQLKKKQLKSQQQLKNLRQQLKQKENLLKKYINDIEDNTDALQSNTEKIKSLDYQLNALKLNFNKKSYEFQQLSIVKLQLEHEVIQLKETLDSLTKQSKERQFNLKNQLNTKSSELISCKEKLNKLQKESSYNQQELSYKIHKLQLQIDNKTEENKDLSIKIKVLNENIYELQMQKNQKGSSVEELQYKIKLNTNEIVFLKKVNEKNNEQINQANIHNKQLKNQIEKLKANVEQLNIEISNLQAELQEITFNGNTNQDQFIRYKQSNKETLLKFLKTITGQGCITFNPDHQQAEIKVLMKQAISNINSYANLKEKQIEQLKTDLNDEVQKNNNLVEELQVMRHENQELTVQYNTLLAESTHLNSNSETIIKEFKIQIAALKKIQSQLGKQIEQYIKELNSLEESLKETLINLEKRQKEIEQFKAQVNKKNQEIQAGIAVNTRLKQEIGKLEETQKKLNNQIKQNKLKQQQLKSSIKQLTQKSRNINKQLKDYEKQVLKKVFDLQAQIKRKVQQNQKLLKESEKKNETIARNIEVSTKLKVQLEDARQTIHNLLKENQSVNNKNEKSNFYTNSLEQQINNFKVYQKSLLLKITQLQKSLKDKNAEYITAREENVKQSKEIQRNGQDYERLSEKNKQNEEIIKKQLLQLTKNQEQLKKLNIKIQFNERQTGDLSTKLKRQLEIEREQKVRKQKEYTTNKDRFEYSINELQRIKLESEIQIKNIKIMNKRLDDQVIELTKSLSQKQRKVSAQDTYLKPVKDNVDIMKGHLIEYSRVGDQFQANKNKLFKLSTTKVQQYPDKYIYDRVKDVSFAYNKMKLVMLSNRVITQQLKAELSEQMKKVQIPLDRILRGDK